MELGIICILLLFAQISASNLIWGGDFEYLTTPFTQGVTAIYQAIDSNVSNWYDVSTRRIEVKSVIGYATTNCTDLSTDYPISLCQNIRLKPLRKYQIKYSAFTMYLIKQMTVTVTIDGVNVSSMYIPTKNTFKDQTQYFYAANKPSGQRSLICFSDVHSYVSPYNPDTYIEYGGLIDNISVIEADYYHIEFTATISNPLNLTSNITYNSTVALQLQNQYKLTASGIQLPNFQHVANLQGLLQVTASASFNFSVSDIQFVYRNPPQINQMIFFTFLIKEVVQSPTPDISLNLNTSSTQNSSLGLISTYQGWVYQAASALNTINEYTFLVTSHLKLILSSYFFFTLISFNNLSLFYIFLHIQTLPQFTKQVYKQLLRVQYSEAGFIYTIQKIFNLESNPFVIRDEIQQISQLVVDQKDGQFWFGDLGLSSLVLQNNSENFLMLAFLVIKLLFLKIILRLISKFKCIPKIKKTHFTLVFLVQFISGFPIMVVSATIRILASVNLYGQRVQKIIQLMLFYASIISIGIFAILNANSLKKRRVQRTSQKTKANLKDITFNVCYAGPFHKSIKQKTDKKGKAKTNYSKFSNQTSDTLLFFTIPFLCAIHQVQIFLVVNSIIIAIKFGSFMHNLRTKRWKRMVLQFFINVVWIVHHVVFIWLFILQSDSIGDADSQQADEQICIILGTTAIMAVLVGYCLELAKFILDVISLLIDIIKKLCSACQYFIKKQKVFLKQKNPDQAYWHTAEKNNKFPKKTKALGRRIRKDSKEFQKELQIQKNKGAANDSSFIRVLKIQKSIQRNKDKFLKLKKAKS